MAANIPGYDYGRALASPVTLAELDELKAAAGWTGEDESALRRAADVLAGEEEALVDGWRGLIGAQPPLAHVFVHPDGSPNDGYKSAVKKRFVQWVRDVLTRPFDQAWLDYQEEIGRRHTPLAKNRTDGGDTPSVVRMRDLVAFLPPTLFAVPDRLRAHGVAGEELDRMARAWTRAVALTIALWTRPYVREDWW